MEELQAFLIALSQEYNDNSDYEDKFNFAKFVEFAAPNIEMWFRRQKFIYLPVSEGDILQVSEGKLKHLSHSRCTDELISLSKELIAQMHDYHFGYNDPINYATRTLEKVKSHLKTSNDATYRHNQQILNYLRSLKICIANLSGEWTHKEKNILLRALLAQLDTAIKNIYNISNDLARGYHYFEDDLLGTDYHLESYRNKIKELENKIAVLEGKKQPEPKQDDNDNF